MIPLHPHLHLLIPSSSPSILLGARLYLPSEALSGTALSSVISTSSSESHNPSPIQHDDLSPQHQHELKGLDVGRVITAAHPWGRLGGDMLDPVLSLHLVKAVYESNPRDLRTAIITYNVRGVGKSQGSSAWVTPGHDPEDFQKVEAWCIDMLGGTTIKDIRRFGYSWGCISATLAPISLSRKLQSIMLISPPISFLPAVTFFSGSINNTLRKFTSPADRSDEVGVWTIYGDDDQFTGVSKYRTWVEGIPGIRYEELKADHFWGGGRDRREGMDLRKGIEEWLEG